MTYTFLAFMLSGFVIVVDLVLLRTHVLRTSTFWISYAILIFFQFFTNGVLTKSKTVTYDPQSVLGSTAEPMLIGNWRLFYAPIEDIFFGFVMIVLTIIFWKRTQRLCH